jgi:hypothetical protein
MLDPAGPKGLVHKRRVKCSSGQPQDVRRATRNAIAVITRLIEARLGDKPVTSTLQYDFVAGPGTAHEMDFACQDEMECIGPFAPKKHMLSRRHLQSTQRPARVSR